MSDSQPQYDTTEAAAAGRLPQEAAGAPRPELVTRGERDTAGTQPGIAHIDWLAFTFRTSETWPFHALGAVLQEVFDVASEVWKPLNRGWMGYKHRVDLGDFGLLAHGGERQRATVHVELNAQGCARVQNWTKVRDWGESENATITRIDLAHDDFEGRTVTVENGLRWYDEGGFDSNGRPPKARYVNDLGSGDGRTLYVGCRASGKLARLYEKGRQLGDPASSWCRIEVEFRSKSRVIPWRTLTHPAEYLSGSFPCLGRLSELQDKIRTMRRISEMSYEGMVEWVKTSAGRALGTMLDVHHGDAAQVLDQVVRSGTPRRLVGLSEYLPKPADVPGADSDERP